MIGQKFSLAVVYPFLVFFFLPKIYIITSSQTYENYPRITTCCSLDKTQVARRKCYFRFDVNINKTKLRKKSRERHNWSTVWQLFIFFFCKKTNNNIIFEVTTRLILIVSQSYLLCPSHIFSSHTYETSSLDDKK